MWKPKVGENHGMVFLYVLKNYIHWKHQLPFFLAATGRRLQPPIFVGYNLREAPTPQLSGYNQKEATNPYVLRTTTGRWLKPPVLALSNCPDV
jgi:hypothetical protein